MRFDLTADYPKENMLEFMKKLLSFPTFAIGFFFSVYIPLRAKTLRRMVKWIRQKCWA